jgi:hypothetical protein
MSIKGSLLAASVASLFVSVAPAIAAPAGSDEVVCDGINACKGKGSCAGKSNACAGQNGCKGHGHTKTTADDCKAKGGKIVKDAK